MVAQRNQDKPFELLKQISDLSQRCTYETTPKQTLRNPDEILISYPVLRVSDDPVSGVRCQGHSADGSQACIVRLDLTVQLFVCPEVTRF